MGEPLKYTLLELVQRVAEYCCAGTVNTINATRESQQIANIVKETYYDLIQRNELEVRYSLFKLQNLSDLEKPTYLLMPDRVWTIDIIRYKDRKTGILKDLQYREPLEFIESSLYLNPKEPYVKQCEDFTEAIFNIRTDRPPMFYTILNDKYLVFDSYDSKTEDTIVDEDILCYGRILPSFEMEDSFVPELSSQQFSILLSNAKINADYELKEHANELELNRARKLWINSTNNARSYTRGTRIWNNRTNIRRR